MRGLSKAVAVAFPILQIGCSPGTASTPDLAAERARLIEADREYVDAANRGDVEALSQLYASDGSRYSPAGPVTSGPDAMRAFAEGVASTPGFHLTARGEPTVELSASGDMAVTLSELDLATTADDGSTAIQRLRDLHIWRREAGGWKIVHDLWQTVP